jgi:hypothetical protein
MTPEMKVIAIAAVVFALVQAIKKFFPKLGGWWALGLNVVLNATGILATAQPGQLFSTGTLLAVVLAIASAAGIHGTWTNLLQPQLTAPAAKP